MRVNHPLLHTSITRNNQIGFRNWKLFLTLRKIKENIRIINKLEYFVAMEASQKLRKQVKDEFMMPHSAQTPKDTRTVCYPGPYLHDKGHFDMDSSTSR